MQWSEESWRDDFCLRWRTGGHKFEMSSWKMIREGDRDCGVQVFRRQWFNDWIAVSLWIESWNARTRDFGLLNESYWWLIHWTIGLCDSVFPSLHVRINCRRVSVHTPFVSIRPILVVWVWRYLTGWSDLSPLELVRTQRISWTWQNSRRLWRHLRRQCWLWSHCVRMLRWNHALKCEMLRFAESQS